MPCNCPKEFSQQSTSSPVAANSTKVIADSEVVLRVVREGIEWNDINSSLKLFSSQDLKDEKRGVSVCRKNYTSPEKITALNAKPVLGAFEASCIAIREIANPVLQPVCIVDDGKESNESHALIVKSRAMDEDKTPSKWPLLMGEIERVFGCTPNCSVKKLEEIFL